MDLYNRKRQFERAVRNIEESDEIKINNKKNFVTEINIKLLGDLVEEIHTKLRNLVKNNDLITTMKNIEELLNRNKIMVYHKMIQTP